MLLLDSFSPVKYGGTGKLANFEYINEAKLNKQFFLAGGLNSENISEAIKTVKPYGVDISGGIETNGFKDKDKMSEIINFIRKQGC